MNYIYTENTPNPDSLKFIVDRDLTNGGTVEARSIEDAQQYPLLEDLLMISDVSSVLVGQNFVTVTRSSGEWSTIGREVTRILSGQFYSPIDTSKPTIQSDDPVINQILDLIEERVRPAVTRDGGDVLFRDYTDGILTLEMMGSCNGCPSSTATLKHGIEKLMRHFIPEIKEVRSI